MTSPIPASIRALALASIRRAVVRRSVAEEITLPFEKDFRLQLMLINREWQDTMLSEEFWTKYRFMALPFTDTVHQLDTLRRLVARSGSEPLTFRFLVDTNRLMVQPNDPTLYFGAGSIDILREIILPYAPRIRVLRCFLPTLQITRILRGIPEGALQSLEVADFACFRSFFHPRSLVGKQKASKLVLFKFLPRLKSVRIYAHSTINVLDLYLLSSPGLTKLDAGNFVLSPEDFMGIIGVLRDVLEVGLFTVQFDAQSCYVAHLLDQVVMSSLEILLIRYIDLFHWPDFPRLVSLPVMKEVRIERADSVWDTRWNFSMYASIFSASSDTLRQLVFSTYPFRPSGNRLHVRKERRRTSYTELEALFRDVPNLTRLSLPLDVYIHVETFAKLAGRELLPKCYAFQFATDVDAQVILAMVASRNRLLDPTPSTLTRVSELILTLPISQAAREQELRLGMSALGLSGSAFGIHFATTCQGCKGHCCFGL
ncbi:hypothetical protein CVT26_011584 [Gymnopilus dilepis]|uniref:F-box domain-containing protein n=1 Tax=Gymnopilus dilepis TaxID=231916 RepID=A0A409VXV5_9AGAR|nr:hypothetical protein CVT26_011584 [Gymnopilus dilepis]